MKFSQKKFKKNILSGAITAAIFSTGALTPVLAEDNSDTETIQVTGIKGSLISASNIKRESFGVVDAITSEDIGKFPDSNLAESLQRITGVSIDRSNNEGNQVSVRGFGPTYNMVTLNGRAMPKSSTLSTDIGINRAFNFQHIAAEVVSEVEVFKTGKANITSGGIGSTINLNTARPFDYGEQKISVSLKGIMDRSNEVGRDITPEYSFLYSNTFADDKFGLLVAYANSERDSRKEAVVNDGWIPDTGSVYESIDASNITNPRNPDGIFWMPRNFAVEYGDHERERDNIQLVLQAKPTEDVEVTLDYVASNFDESINRIQTGFWFDSDANTTGNTDANGTVVNPRHKNHRLNFTAIHQFVETENDSIGVNVKWKASDTLSLEFDAHDSTSESQPSGDISEFTTVISTPPDERYVDIGLDFTNADVPAVFAQTTQTLESLNAPGPIPNPHDPYALENIDGDVVVVRGHAIENNIKQWEFSGQWLNANDGALANVSFGVGNTDYQFNTTRRFGFAVIYDSLNMNDLGLSFTPATVGKGFSGSDELFPLQFNADPKVVNQAVVSNGLINEDPTSRDWINEDTFHAYVALEFGGEFNGYPVSVNAGLRYEDTKVVASSTATLPEQLAFLHSEEIRGKFANGVIPIDTLEGGYTEFLPNLDVGVELSEDIMARLSYSRTITRSDVSSIAPATRITNMRPGGPFNAVQGDPNLLPYSSNNFDLSIEYYYDEGSYVSAGYFKKFVSNFIGSTTETRSINGSDGNPLTDPSINPRPGCPDASTEPYNENCLSRPSDPVVPFDVTVPKNLEDAEVDGIELALQHMFGDTGFGTIVNYTKVDGSVEFDVYSFTQTVALTGLSDSANLVAFYDKDGFQARFAYNWRDEFLLKTNQFHSTGEPIFTEAYGQLDFSVSYEINDTFTVTFDGLNILEETAHRHGRFDNQFLAAEDFGSRYTLGVRANF